MVGIEPTIDGVGVSGLQEPFLSHPMGRASVSDLEHGRGAFADVGFGVVVSSLEQFVALRLGQGQSTSVSHHVSKKNKVKKGELCFYEIFTDFDRQNS